MQERITAPDLLQVAHKHMSDRAATYDKPEGERSMGKAVHAFNAITDRDLTEAEGWLLLQVLKDVRLWQRPGYHADSAEDCIAYAALKAEAKAQEVIPAHACAICGAPNGGQCGLKGGECIRDYGEILVAEAQAARQAVNDGR